MIINTRLALTAGGVFCALVVAFFAWLGAHIERAQFGESSQ